MALLTGCQATPNLPGSGLQGAQKLLKKRPGVVRSGRGLGVVLHPEYRQLAVAKALDRPVIEIHMGHFQLGGAQHAILIPLDGESVVLRGDEHPPRLDFPDRMISTPMTVGHLGRIAAEGEPEQLGTEADSEGRDSARRKLAESFPGVADRRRIAGSVR